MRLPSLSPMQLDQTGSGLLLTSGVTQTLGVGTITLGLGHTRTYAVTNFPDAESCRQPFHTLVLCRWKVPECLGIETSTVAERVARELISTCPNDVTLYR